MLLQQLIQRLFGFHTIESATSLFDRAIEKLKAVERQEVEKMERAKEKIAKHEAKLAEAVHNATVARNKREKFDALFGASEADAEPNINTLRAVA